MIGEEKNIERLFDLAKSEPTGFSFNAASHSFKQSLNSGAYISKAVKVTAKKNKFLKIIIMSISAISIVTIVSILFFNSNTPQNETVETKKLETVFTESEIEIERQTKKKGTNQFITEKTTVKELKIETLPLKEIVAPAKQLVNRTFTKNQKYNKQIRVNNTYEYFPKLTSEDIQENDKRIKKMVKDFVKKKKDWSYLPSGSFNIAGKTVSLQAFYVKATEVTNLEYKTFLFDLLKNDKKEEFNKAKPNQKAWTETFGEFADPMTKMYFSHPAYDDYPVVNITAVGAKMYSDWFTKKVREVSKEEINSFRLPVDAEWRYVASEMGRFKKYAWDGQYLRNAKGCYLSNFHAGTESDTVKNEYKADGGFYTVKVDSYFPTAQEVFNISGNVAEIVMVKQEEKYTAKIIGGSFLSNAEELQLNYPAQDILHPKGTPSVGFRPVITYLSQPKTFED